jgi:hypothetical protein
VTKESNNPMEIHIKLFSPAGVSSGNAKVRYAQRIKSGGIRKQLHVKES